MEVIEDLSYQNKLFFGKVGHNKTELSSAVSEWRQGLAL